MEMMMQKITRKRFIEATGHEPQDDDLERSNCKKGGKIGHFHCGWSDRLNLPVFMAAAIPEKTPQTEKAARSSGAAPI